VSASSSPELWVDRLGTAPYAQALELQRGVARQRIDGSVPEDVLLLLEHPPVVTLGRSAKEKHLLASPELLRARGVELFEVERGGDVTFHGPGQLVGYPIIDLKHHKKDLHWYLRQVEEALIRGVAPFGIVGERNVGYTGVWTQGRKLASIGVHARDWVTWHGFALNVTTDLSYFDLMVPCGIAEVQMTSLARELAAREAGRGHAAMDLWLRTGENVGAAFAELFGLAKTALDPQELQRRVTVEIDA
jgi:lipoyl(octanoyl) transferase